MSERYWVQWMIIDPSGPVMRSNTDTRSHCIRLWLNAWQNNTVEHRTWRQWRRMGFRCVAINVPCHD